MLRIDRDDNRYEAVPNIPHFRLLAVWIWDMHDYASDMAGIPRLGNIATNNDPIAVATSSLLRLAQRRPLIIGEDRFKQVSEQVL